MYELLKDQLVFGFYNKEVQDHFLGELSDMDNSVKALYEACKVESKLEQRKELGIVNPSVVDIAAVKWGNGPSENKSQCDYCGQHHKWC